MKSFFDNFFGKKPQPQNDEQPSAHGQRVESGFYKKGDVIGGKYEVRSTLGKGGFGVVYLVYIRDTREMCALKTFRDELLPDPAAREAFKKEALLWVNLEMHPCILVAGWADEVSGRLFIAMEPIAPDAQGRVSLADHLARPGGPLDTNQALKWAIQFCLGMEHARARGIQCHRDIKPANILISHDGTLKIGDFGLAAAAEVAWRGSSRQRGAPSPQSIRAIQQLCRIARGLGADLEGPNRKKLRDSEDGRSDRRFLEQQRRFVHNLRPTRGGDWLLR